MMGGLPEEWSEEIAMLSTDHKYPTDTVEHLLMSPTQVQAMDSILSNAAKCSKDDANIPWNGEATFSVHIADYEHIGFHVNASGTVSNVNIKYAEETSDEDVIHVHVSALLDGDDLQNELATVIAVNETDWRFHLTVFAFLHSIYILTLFMFRRKAQNCGIDAFVLLLPSHFLFTLQIIAIQKSISRPYLLA